MNDKYDVKGRVHTLEQRTNWNLRQLDRLLNHDSFDVEFSPSGQVLQVTTYNMAGGVIGSNHFEYGNSGKTSRSLQLDSAGRQIHTTKFFYETQGNRVTTTSETDGKFAGRTIEVSEGSSLLSFASYDSGGLLRREKTFHYAGSALQTSDSRYYLSDGTLLEQWLSSYDAQGRIVETYGLKADGKPLGDGKYKFDYDSEGRPSRTGTFNEYEHEEQAIAIKRYEYETDESGNWTARHEQWRSRGDSAWSTKITTRKLTYYPPD
jgi:hypothetical protein